MTATTLLRWTPAAPSTTQSRHVQPAFALCTTRSVCRVQQHAVASLPSAAKPWRRDSMCPPPLGRDDYFPIVSSTTPLTNRWPTRFRADLVKSCHLELAQASVAPAAYLPHRVLIDEVSDDGDGFAMAVHAAALAQWGCGVRGVRVRAEGEDAARSSVAPAPDFAAFGIAGLARPQVELGSTQPDGCAIALMRASPAPHATVNAHNAVSPALTNLDAAHDGT